MEQKASLNVEMPGVDFTDLARQTISAKLTEALTQYDDIAQSIIVAALESKVGSNGVKSRYPSDNKTPYIEWLTHDLIQKAVKTALQERVEALRPALNTAIEKQLKRSTNRIAKALTETFIARATKGYGVNVKVEAAMNYKDD